MEASLELGLSFSPERLHQNPRNRKPESKDKALLLKFDHVLPCLALGSNLLQSRNCCVQTSSVSPGSSYSNSSTVKRERVAFGCEGFEVEKAVSSRGSDEDEEASCPTKKLRLTKQQSAVLEDSFKQHSTLNPKQKQELARQLKLRARQVEVWFQNRRARTKLKQTEMEFELLKKCCQNLTDENKRLHSELNDLRALKLPPAPSLSPPTPSAPAVFMPTALTICPSCDKISAVDSPPKVNAHGSLCSTLFPRFSAACN